LKKYKKYTRKTRNTLKSYKETRHILLIEVNYPKNGKINCFVYIFSKNFEKFQENPKNPGKIEKFRKISPPPTLLTLLP